MGWTGNGDSRWDEEKRNGELAQHLPGSLFLLVSPLLLFISTSDIILVWHQAGQSCDKNGLLDKNNEDSKTGIPNSFTTGKISNWWDNKWKEVEDDQGYISIGNHQNTRRRYELLSLSIYYKLDPQWGWPRITRENKMKKISRMVVTWR